MNKYRIYVVDSNDNFDKYTAGYQEIKDSAIDYVDSDSFKSLLELLIGGINCDEFSDQNWYFLTDESEGIVLMSLDMIFLIKNMIIPLM